MTSRPHVMLIGPGLAATLLMLPGCVAFEIRDELRKTNENLAAANTQLMVANTELDAANAKLLEANARLVDANRDLTTVNGHLGSLRNTLDNIDSMIPFINITDDGPEPAPTTSPADTTAATPTPPADGGGTTPATTPGTAPTGIPPATTALRPPQETTSRMLPETVTIDGQEFRLTAYLWRNFQPTVGEAPGAKGLLASLKLVAADSTASDKSIPKGVEAAAVRLQRGKSVWTGTAANEAKADGTQTWERMIRPGPAWEVGPGVNVFVQLVLPDGGKKWIAAYNQTIERVD